MGVASGAGPVPQTKEHVLLTKTSRHSNSNGRSHEEQGIGQKVYYIVFN